MVLTSAAKTAQVKCSTPHKKTTMGNKNEKRSPWYNNQCRLNKIKSYAKIIRADPFNNNHVFELYKLNKEYKKYIKSCKNNHEKYIGDKLNNMRDSDPKLFWNLYTKLNEHDKKTQN